MDSPSAITPVLDTPELLCMVLAHLPSGELLRLQRVCRSWQLLITKTPNLCATTFTGPAPSRRIPNQTPHLNQFVINRLRWIPSLDPTQVNTTQFYSVQGNPSLQAMAHENASWRNQYLTWPPLLQVTFMFGTISQEEPGLPDLLLSSHGRSPDQSVGYEEEEGSGDEDSDSDDSDMDVPPFILYIDDFPHNANRDCQGITVLDMIYGLRMYYLQYKHTLQIYLTPGVDAGDGGKLLVGIEKDRRGWLIDVTDLNF
ncbi:hypothetical protein FE257_000784 [Aspergillus nanangensis]|uniref:F-box domain-containing protein n=1 Tax=Aspergillus nanangensis TaxID=2582783 RepID=A0AAD4CF00_ASPNN|nr:hypothetical protein FE257_000784 [Aspergillus nanangensis]